MFGKILINFEESFPEHLDIVRRHAFSVNRPSEQSCSSEWKTLFQGASIVTRFSSFFFESTTPAFALGISMIDY